MGLLDNFDVDDEMKDLIRDKLKDEPSFKNVFIRDLTKQVMSNLKKRMTGKMTSHFVLFISGVPSITTTGTFKSSMAMELGIMFDPEFDVTNIGFTNDELLDILKEKGKVTKIGKEKAQVFVRDEGIASLKIRARVEFSIVVETLRDSRISLIVVKPTGEPPETAHYHLQGFLFNGNNK